MSRQGEVYENPVTGERSIVLTDPYAHPESVLVAHLVVAPGGRAALAHEETASVDSKGLPHPLQLAVTASAYRDTMIPASPPVAVQRALLDENGRLRFR